MPNNREPSIKDEFYLPKYQYRTAVNFCYQYKELKAEYEATDGQRGMVYDDMPHGSGTSDPAFIIGAKRAELAKKIELIEQSVLSACGSRRALYRLVLLGVTDESMTFNRLKAVYNIPVNKNQYTRIRRAIYWTVAQKL